MRETLFFVPHYLFTGPLLWGWLVIGGLILVYLWLRPNSKKNVIEFIPFYLAVAAVIHFVLPILEVPGIDPANPAGPYVPMGIAVRGYGFFLLLGMVCGIGVTVWRSQKFGISADQVFSLTFLMVVCGIVGARLFYVIQKYDDFAGQSPVELIKSVLDMTKGGLVVYGSLIGGMIGAAIFLWRTKLPMLRMADLLAPGMALGLTLGRLGCLMNGCCFGGVCDAELPSLEFPVGSPPYMRQLDNGELLGMTLERSDDFEFGYRVKSVKAGSLAEQHGIGVEDYLRIGVPGVEPLRAAKSKGIEVEADAVIELQKQGETRARIIVVPVEELPVVSLPVHPTQLYSSLNAFCLFLFLWFYFPYRKANGEVFALLLILYSIARFLLESIRTDELGLFGTELTISQWISVAALGVGVLMFLAVRINGVRSKAPGSGK